MGAYLPMKFSGRYKPCFIAAVHSVEQCLGASEILNLLLCVTPAYKTSIPTTLSSRRRPGVGRGPGKRRGVPCAYAWTPAFAGATKVGMAL